MKKPLQQQRNKGTITAQLPRRVEPLTSRYAEGKLKVL